MIPKRAFTHQDQIGFARLSGDFNSETLAIVKDMGASIGVTTESRVANLKYDDNLKLPRFDTNDFPQ